MNLENHLLSTYVKPYKSGSHRTIGCTCAARTFDKTSSTFANTLWRISSNPCECQQDNVLVVSWKPVLDCKVNDPDITLAIGTPSEVACFIPVQLSRPSRDAVKSFGLYVHPTPTPLEGLIKFFFLNFKKLGFKMFLALISTGILLASWKFREITSLFKNCLSSKFQLPRPCGALVVVDPLFEEKNSKCFFLIFWNKKVHLVGNPQFSI